MLEYLIVDKTYIYDTFASTVESTSLQLMRCLYFTFNNNVFQ